MNLSPDKQREMLRQMLTIRRFEERASADYHAGKIYGVVHCYIGEEAVAVGVCSALDQRRPDHLDASRPRPLHRQGRRPQAHDGRALRPADRLLQGQGRLHAHRRFRHRHARRQRHRRGRHLDRHRRGARGADGRQGRRRGLLLRRRRIERGAVPRVPQHRGDLEAADALRLREQHVCGADGGGRDARHAATWPAAPPATAFRASSSTATTSSPSIRRPARGRSGAPGRRRPDADRVQDLPLARPHRAHRPARFPRPRTEIEAWKQKDPIARLLERQLQGPGRPRPTPSWQAMSKRGAGHDRGRGRVRRGEPLPDARSRRLDDMYAA